MYHLKFLTATLLIESCVFVPPTLSSLTISIPVIQCTHRSKDTTYSHLTGHIICPFVLHQVWMIRNFHKCFRLKYIFNFQVKRKIGNFSISELFSKVGRYDQLLAICLIRKWLESFIKVFVKRFSKLAGCTFL